DLVVFGRRAGLYAALYVKDLGGRLTIDPRQVEAAADEMSRPFGGAGGENPYTIQADLQDAMQSLVGIIRTEAELREALTRIEGFRTRARNVRVAGGRRYNPEWHTTLDLLAMLTVSEAVTRAALERKESRGGHTRDDYPKADPEWGKVNVVVRCKDGRIQVGREPLREMPAELRQLLEETR
ncbi:MAG: fumarate reductase/succinate dehydrogenase flavoprotein subunit, partial [Candidatus Rokubacteria bacterium]|nr:fumarate reductase/succinate dehydrogenase flavoprotein subunit [Candidatus Rokubacteria bacterium]